MNKRIVSWSCFSIMAAIAVGAFGAHGLRKMTTDENLLRGFQTGVDYHLFHSIAFLFFGLWASSVSGHKLRITALIYLVVGVFLFSGSLYALTVFKLMGWSHSWIGPVTPVGGTFLILGWGWMGYSFLKAERSN